MTAEELLSRPDDGFRYELLHGELRQMSPAGHVHGRVAVNITVALAEYVRPRGLGVVYAAETGFKLASRPDHVRAPDVGFVAASRAQGVPDGAGFWPGAPDLAVEVVSPSDSFAAVEEKVLDWLGAGTRLVIVVDPSTRTATTYRSLTDVTVLTEDGTIEGGDVVPGWTLPVRTALQ
jgi:Uma2 family endonuclease